MLKNDIRLYNGLASRSDLNDKYFTLAIDELKDIGIDGFPNDGWNDHWARRWEFPVVTSAVLQNTKAGDRILESGSGITPVPFWLANFGLNIVGVDLEQALVPRWLSVTTKRGSASLTIGDMLNIPFGDDQFAASYSISAIEHTGNAPKAVSEMIRVVRPAGVVTFTMDIDIKNTDSVPPDHFAMVQEILQAKTTPVYPSRYYSPSDLLTFTQRTLKPQSPVWRGLKYFLGESGVFKWKDQCVFFYCGRKK